MTITETRVPGAEQQPQAPEPAARRHWRAGWAAFVVTALSRAVLTTMGSLLATSLLPVLFGWHSAVVLSGSMQPRLAPGDIAVVRPVSADKFNPGQVLLVHDPDHAGRLRLHRLVAVRPDGMLTLRGDANPQADSTPVARNAVVGVAALRVPWIGLPDYWLHIRRFAAVGVTLIAGLAALGGAFLYRASEQKEDGDSGPSGPASRRRGRAVLARIRRPAPPRRRPQRSHLALRARLRARLLTVLTVSALVVMAGMAPSAFAVFWKTALNSGDSWSATNYFSCKDAVMAASPAIFYRLNDSGPSTVADSSGNNATGAYQGSGTTFGVSGACPRDNNPAINLDGATGYISTPNSYNSPNTFTLEVWFNTVGKPGGDLISFGTAKTGASPAASVDRAIYLNSGGALFFAVNGANIGTVNKYNDGNWHLVDAILSPAGMVVYVDGGSTATGGAGETLSRGNVTSGISETGYWKIGYDDLSIVASQHPAGSNFFGGSLDEVAIYNTALTQQQAKDHYYAS